MEVKEAMIEILEDDGWVQVRQESSHFRTFKKDGVANNVSVAGTDPCEQVSPGVLSNIRRETGLTLR